MSGDNGHGHLVRVDPGGNNSGALTAFAPPVVVAYEPRPRDWALFDAWCRLHAEGKPATQVNLAHLVGISRQAVSYRFRQPGFGLWWQQQMRQLSERYWREAVVAQAKRAASDLEAFKVLLPLFEPTAAPAPAGGGGGTNNGFVVHVHG